MLFIVQYAELQNTPTASLQMGKNPLKSVLIKKKKQKKQWKGSSSTGAKGNVK